MPNPRVIFAALTLGTLAATGCAGSNEVDDEEEAVESGSDAYSSELQNREAERRTEVCFSHDWSKESFRYAEDAAYLPDQDWASYLASGLAGLFGDAGEQVGRLVFRGSKGSELIDGLILRLSALGQKQGLVPYQLTYASLCVSSQLFKYSMSGIAKLLGSSAAAEYEAGVCTEYSRVATRLLNGVGIWADEQGVLRERHSFVEVWYKNVDGTSYYVEPQRDPRRGGVVFYNKH